MTVQELFSATEQPRRRARPSARLFWMVAAVFVLIALLIVGWKWRHPTAFVNYGGWGVSTRDVPSGSTVYVTVTEPSNYDGGTVTLHGVAAHWLVDSTDAAIGYVLCTPVPGPNTIGIETTADLRRSCGRLVSARDVAMSLQGQQLLLAITPQHAGNIVFQGADVRYSQGWQDGTQRVGPDVRIRVSPAK